MIPQPAEPTYAGRSLESWLDSSNGPVITLQRKTAVTHIVTNCLPTLVRQLEYNPIPRRARMAAIVKWIPKPLLRNQRLVRFVYNDPKDRGANVALMAFVIAGPAAKAAAPDLRQMAMTKNPPACTRAIQVLIGIDDDAAATLAAIALNPKHPARYYALSSGAASQTITPELIQLLVPAVTNSNEQIACLAIDAIGEIARLNRDHPIEVFIQETDLLVPTLQRATHDPRDRVSQTANEALGLLAAENKHRYRY